MRHSLFLIILLALTQCAHAATNNIFPRGYVCYKTSEHIKVDGKLDDAAWQKAAWTDDYIDIRGINKPKPLYRTRSKMLWDDKYLYIGAYLEEPYVWATLTKHDAIIYMENCFEVFIDPDGDNQKYYEIEINALNAIWDLYMSKPYRDDGWNDGKFELPGIKHAVYVDGKLNSFRQKDKGWSVEYAIPWKALKVFAFRPTPPNEGDQWRVNFLRIQYPIILNPKKSQKLPNLPIGKPKNVRETFASWCPLGAVDAHKPESFGFVQFTSNKPGTVSFKRNPDQDIRSYLMRIYFAEKRFFRRNQNWTTSFSELGLKPDSRYADSLRFELTDAGFRASIDSIGKPGKRLNIREDSRLWMEDK